MINEQLTERIERERTFYDQLVRRSFSSRRLLDKLSAGYYDKTEAGRIWSPIWKKVDLAGKDVLDFCCGNGDFSFALATRGANVQGFDISPELIAFAEDRVPPGIKRPIFSVRDGHATGFPDGSFDFVFGNGVLHHLQLGLAYPEIARILKPGGKAFFMEPLEGNPFMRLLRKATPAAHTEDETPLLFADVNRAKAYFSHVTHTEHFCLALAAAPFHLLSSDIAKRVIGGLDRIDGMLFTLIPPLRSFAWLSMLELTA